MDIHKTIISVTVLSDGPLPEDRGEDSNWLAFVAEEIESGPAIGDWRIVSDEIVPPAAVGAELVAIGNDGSFFRDD
jgi:hypothetical protein